MARSVTNPLLEAFWMNQSRTVLYLRTPALVLHVQRTEAERIAASITHDDLLPDYVEPLTPSYESHGHILVYQEEDDRMTIEYQGVFFDVGLDEVDEWATVLRAKLAEPVDHEARQEEERQWKQVQREIGEIRARQR